MSTHAYRLHEFGTPDVLRWEPVELAAPRDDQAIVNVHAAGFNFMDIHHRRGRGRTPLPCGIGVEAVGVIADIGANAFGLSIGMRVAYADQLGAYAERQLVDAKRLIPLPDDIGDTDAASLMSKGITAHYLLHAAYPVAHGATILVHAAAGGVGQLLCQWGSSLGATVIGSVSSQAKFDVARQGGCQHIVLAGDPEFVAKVRGHTRGRGVDAVYDAVGSDVWDASIACLRPRGVMVSFGSASGLPRPIDVGQLKRSSSSVFISFPTFWDHTITREELIDRAEAVLQAVRARLIIMPQPSIVPMAHAAQVHVDVEARRTTGAIVMVPR